nr:MAG TPA: hypothetical protein [Caudoviricetes sp.]
MLAFILLGIMFTANLAYESLRADSKVMMFLGSFLAGMCAMCVIIGIGYTMGAN